jgi:hypothetical protein
MIVTEETKQSLDYFELQHYNNVLKSEVKILTSRLEPHDTGHLHTAIGVLKHRIGELEKEINGNE